MTHRKTLIAAGLIFAALGLDGLAYASPPTSVSLSSGVLVRAPSPAIRSRFRLDPAMLAALDASSVSRPTGRLHGLTGTLLQTPPQSWSEGQPVTLLIGIGPSDPRYHRLPAGTRPSDAAASLTSGTATGWTRPLGMRLALRW
jgi:hypothetical protein